jgi:hypothetical protein
MLPIYVQLVLKYKKPILQRKMLCSTALYVGTCSAVLDDGSQSKTTLDFAGTVLQTPCCNVSHLDVASDLAVHAAINIASACICSVTSIAIDITIASTLQSPSQVRQCTL